MALRWTGLLRAAALTVALTAALAACDSVDERVAKHYARGMALIEEGQPEKARLEFRNALRLNADHAPSRFEIAKAYEADGEIRAALSNYRLVAELDPQNFEARVRIARFLLLGGDVEEALKQVEAALVLRPDDPEAVAVKAAVNYRRGDAEAALAGARKAIAADPDRIEAHMVLATERADAGDWDGALAVADGVLARNPDDRVMNLFKLSALERAGRRDAAAAHLETLIVRYPDETGFRRALAQVRLNAGDLDGAEAQARALADAPGATEEDVLRLVRLLLDHRSADAARAEITARIAAAGGSAQAVALTRALVALELRAGRRDAALTVLREALAADPDGLAGRDARIRLAALALEDGDRDAARRLTSEVLAADAENVDALALRAQMAIDDEDPQSAIRDLRVALDAAPQDVRLLLLSARAYDRDGSPDLAGERLAAATRASDFEPRVAARYAAFLRGRNQPEAAEGVLAQAARRHRDNPALLAALAELRIGLKNWPGAQEMAEALAALDSPVSRAAAEQVRAGILRGQGRVAESESVLAALVETGEGGSAKTTLAMSAARDGRLDEAEALTAEVIAETPDDLRARLLAAELRLMRRDVAGAEARLREAVAAAPTASMGYVAQARLALALRRPEEAERILRDALDPVAEETPLRLMLAQMAEGRGDFDAALMEYETLYERQPDSAILANNLASLLAEHRAEDPEALRRAEQIARRLRASDEPHFRDTYGWILFLNGDVAEAARYVSGAAEGLPGNPIVRYHAGRVYAALGQQQKAREHLLAALTLDPNFSKAASAERALEGLAATETVPVGQ